VIHFTPPRAKHVKLPKIFGCWKPPSRVSQQRPQFGALADEKMCIGFRLQFSNAQFQTETSDNFPR
jgi:hypothetical protein